MDSSARASQPGLEVRNTYDTDPIVVDNRTGHWAAPSHDGSGHSYAAISEPKIPSGNSRRTLAQRLGFASDAFVEDRHDGYGGHHGVHGAQQPGRGRRFPWPPFAIGGLIVLVLGGIVGGIIGWKVVENHSQQPAENLPGAVGSPLSTSATKIMQNSALAAVGWRFGPDITLQVFFQGADASMRRSQYMSLFQNWTAPMEAGAAPKANSPFGASQLWTKPTEALPEIPQTEVFYIGSPNSILGVNWRDGFSRGGLPDSVNEGGYTLSNTGTQMAAYWPSTLLQASNGDVMEVFYDYKAPKFQEPTAVGITASPGSALVILPREVIHSAGEGTASSSARIIYRSTDGRLENYDRTSGGQKVTSSGQLPVTVDSNFTMAGFAVARLDSGSGGSSAVNTWILYQDSKTGKISYVYEDDATGWKGPETDAVFEGADNPTHLACVTASSAKVPQVPLVASHDLSHCFFQVKRQLKHVHFDGSKWSDMGFLPIP
ncbi:hypothetical protein LY78DRAFT_435400 [Colletotrichum sublineola]|nr:hypothetical protein LY78DRAFT_435400 [Colletotrichum sublineola]